MRQKHPEHRHLSQMCWLVTKKKLTKFRCLQFTQSQGGSWLKTGYRIKCDFQNSGLSVAVNCYASFLLSGDLARELA